VERILSDIYNRMFFLKIGKVCFERRQDILRLGLLLCICYALVTGFVWPRASFSLSPAEAIEVGVGGGGYLEGTVSSDFLQTVEESPVAGIAEPESFSKPRTLLYSTYTVAKNDVISEMAAGFGLNQDTLISINNIRNTRLIQIGQVLRIPNQDGIMYTVARGDTLESIAKKYSSDTAAIRTANELFADAIRPGMALFVPGAQLGWVERQEINGDLFIWPASGTITSNYGYRPWPFGDNVRQFHSGMDIGAPTGSPVRAAMSGRVSSVGWDDTLGNHVVISHHSGYRTMYGHMSRVTVRSGAYVGAGERIGDVGSTGVSTGPHLHFTVYKNGVTVNPRTLLK